MTFAIMVCYDFNCFPYLSKLLPCRAVQAKDDIRSLLRTDPSERMTIHTLMLTPLVTGEEQPQ
ncbi:unnamed protein product, partial [Nippostrongylus brasiliensis]|uniref:Transcriptional regulator n=1 Tax=Nippostrongylus brasiliensis TaxID=27835 RepID=A0A0N4XI80_NIPBR